MDEGGDGEANDELDVGGQSGAVGEGEGTVDRSDQLERCEYARYMSWEHQEGIGYLSKDLVPCRSKGR